MIWIHVEQLLFQLKKELKRIYILYGNDPYLLQDSQFNIIKIAKTFNFEHFSVYLYNNISDWNKIFNLCRTSNIFAKKIILSLNFSENYSMTYLKKNISLLSNLSNKNFIFIVNLNTNYLKEKKNIWVKYFDDTATYVVCNTPKNIQLEMWIIKESNSMSLRIDKLTCQLLCYYYEDNLMALNQILKHLSLIYPDKNINLTQVKNIIVDAAYFNINHWIESILIGQKHRSTRILQKLIQSGIDLNYLLYKTQKEILMLNNIKYKKNMKIELFLFKQKKIYGKYHRILLFRALQRLNTQQLYQAIALLVHMEIICKKNDNCLSYMHFESLIITLCTSQN